MLGAGGTMDEPFQIDPDPSFADDDERLLPFACEL
jgi:hypothetical protein